MEAVVDENWQNQGPVYAVNSDPRNITNQTQP